MPDTDLDSFRANAAPPSDEARAHARIRLLDAIARAPTIKPAPRWRPPRRLSALAAVLGAVAILVIAEPWQTEGRDIARAAAAMVAVKPGAVLHIRAQGHHIYTPFSEQWIEPNGSWRDKHGGTNQSGRPCTVESSLNTTTRVLSTYDAPTRSIYSLTLSAKQARLATYPDQLAQVRAWLAAGALQPAGHARIDGQRVIRLAPTLGHRLQGVMAYYVDARTSAPVRWQINATQWYDFTIYERLPASRTNNALTSVQAQHPQAAQHAGSGPRGGCGSG